MQDTERFCVVHRSELVLPGRPYVLSECAEELFAALSADISDDLTAHTREAMLADPGLCEALAAWEAGDDSLCRREDAGVTVIVEAGRIIG